MFQLFELLALFDWITPLWGFFQDFRHDPTLLQKNSWTFFIDYRESISAGWNYFNIRDLLHRYGIQTWGSQITNNELFFSVKLEQAQWAEFLLLSNSVPINPQFVGAPKGKDGKINQYRSASRVQEW